MIDSQRFWLEQDFLLLARFLRNEAEVADALEVGFYLRNFAASTF